MNLLCDWRIRPLCQSSIMPMSLTPQVCYALCPLCQVSFMLYAPYASGPLCNMPQVHYAICLRPIMQYVSGPLCHLSLTQRIRYVIIMPLIPQISSALFYSRLYTFTAGSSLTPESLNFLCPLLFLSMFCTVAPRCHFSRDALVFQLILCPLSTIPQVHYTINPLSSLFCTSCDHDNTAPLCHVSNATGPICHMSLTGLLCHMSRTGLLCHMSLTPQVRYATFPYTAGPLCQCPLHHRSVMPMSFTPQVRYANILYTTESVMPMSFTPQVRYANVLYTTESVMPMSFTPQVRYANILYTTESVMPMSFTPQVRYANILYTTGPLCQCPLHHRPVMPISFTPQVRYANVLYTTESVMPISFTPQSPLCQCPLHHRSVMPCVPYTTGQLCLMSLTLQVRYAT